MFSANRIIAIDDERVYLDKLSKALHGMGIPCIPIHYDDLPSAQADWFQRIRIAFFDLHLIKGASKPDFNYAAIGSLLDRMRSPHGCPLLLILWTAYPQDAVALRDYLNRRHIDSLPIDILALNKADFEGDLIANLPEAIKLKLQSIPQLRALYEWEDDVANAGSACVGTLLRLATQTGGALADSLDKLLSALAQAATGVDLAAANPGASVQEVLVPLIADKLSHFPDDANRAERWKLAMPSAVSKSSISPSGAEIAAINTALSVVRGKAGSLNGRERGAVIAVQCPSIFMYRFGNSQSDVSKKYCFDETVKHRWVAVQVEASCDFAQQKSPCLPYVLAAEIPASAKLKNKSLPIWESPTFLSETNEEVRLVANVCFVAMISWKKAKSRHALYRFREQLVNELAFKKSRHESRPGIVSL